MTDRTKKALCIFLPTGAAVLSITAMLLIPAPMTERQKREAEVKTKAKVELKELKTEAKAEAEAKGGRRASAAEIYSVCTTCPFCTRK